jgi:predicted RNA-binding protein with TRAM domain
LSDRRQDPGEQKPVEIGKEYTVDITDTGRTGDGVTKISGLVVFVKNAKAGRKNMKIKIISVGSRHAKAEVIAESA